MARKSTPASRRVPAPTSVTTDPQPLALSDFHLRLEFLERENQKSIEQIEKKRRELNNLLERIQEIGVEISQRSAPLFQKLVEIDRQIHAVFAEIFNGRKLGKQTRKNVETIYENLQASGLISPNPNRSSELDDEDEDPDDPDWDGSGYEDSYQEFNFRSEPEPKKLDRDELKKIRQLYLRLADVFHPDKVLDAADKEYRTEVMKEINQAYQAGDLAKLLTIERQHQLGEIIDRDSENDLARRCDRLEQENEFLKSQLTNIKQEIKVMKKSREGSMVADYRKMTKNGLDPIGEALAQTEVQIKTIDGVYQFVVDFRDKRMTIGDFMQGPEVLRQMVELSQEELLMELFSQL